MATLEKRPLKDKKTIRHRVKWRIGGTGDWDGETFNNATDAKRFKTLIELHRHHRPPADQLVAHGFADLVPVGSPPREHAAAPTTVAPAALQADQPDAPERDGTTGPLMGEPHSAVRTPTFNECAEQMISNLDHVNGYTKRRYRGMLRLHVADDFGLLLIDEIEYEHGKQWQRHMVAKGLSRKSIANIRGGVIWPTFAAACKPHGRKPPLIRANPFDGLKLPAGRGKRRDVITSERDIALYMGCAYEVDPEAGDLLMVGLATGMRWGDLAGLRVRDIDLDEAEIRPSQVLARGSEDHDRWELRPYTKTIAGDERVVPIPPGIVALLRRRSAGRRPNDLVFTAPGGGPWDHARFREHRYIPILRLAQERGLARHITPHALRHSLLTMLADAGTDPKVMQHMAGHETITTLYNTYIRPTKAQRASAAATVGGLLAGALLGERGGRSLACERDQADGTC